MNSYNFGFHKKNTGGYVLIIVIILLTIATFIITSSWYILNIFLKNGEMSFIDTNAKNLLESQRIYFQNTLINTNTDGGGYTTNGLSKEDENHDNDDFHGELVGSDNISDDDGMAFMYKYGFIGSGDKANVLFIDKKYRDITGLGANSFSGFNISLDKNADATVEIYDGNIYEESRDFVLKTKKIYPLQTSKNFIPLSATEIAPNDIILIFISNMSFDIISYSIGGVNLQGKDILIFMPAINHERNIDLYTNVVIEDKDGKYIASGQMFYDLLPGGKRPVSPTYLHMKSLTGGILELEWDINDQTNTGSYYLYRGIDILIDCKPEYFHYKIPDGYKENNISIESATGRYYYALCGSNSMGSGSGLDNIGKLSLKSNILQVIK